MKIKEEQHNVYLYGIRDFDIEQILECGQCFHFKKIAEKEYGISAHGRLLHVKQEVCEETSSLVLYNCDLEEYNAVWEHYFDLNRDYGAIKKELLLRDNKLKEAMDVMWGIRILNQEFFETMISFIISQNKQIPHIKQIVEKISIKYGKYLGTIGKEEFYSFPDVNTLKEVTEEEWRMLKVGFRAPYIVDAIQKILSGEIAENVLMLMNREDAMKELMKVKGIGEKVANCILLFSLGKRDAFPVDVWMKRIMEYLYFHEETDNQVIRKRAIGMYGEYGGYAQQYLFYYGKVHNLGKTGKNG